MAKSRRILKDGEKALILALFDMGRTDNEVADILHLSRTGFRNILKYNKVKVTRKKGLADSKVEASLYSQAMKGNITAQIFWLCNRKGHDWKNVQKMEATHTGEVKVRVSYVDSKRKNK